MKMRHSDAFSSISRGDSFSLELDGFGPSSSSHRHGVGVGVDGEMMYGDDGDWSGSSSSTSTLDPAAVAAAEDEGSRFFVDGVTNGDNDNLFFSKNKSSWPSANTNTSSASAITRGSEPIVNMWDSFSSWFSQDDPPPVPSLYASSSLTASAERGSLEPISLASSFFFNETHYRYDSNNYEQVYSFIDDDSDTFVQFDNYGNETGFGYNCTLNGTCPDSGPHQQNYWALLLILFPLFTVFGNVLVILSVKRERSLQNITNYFIVSLAVADLLVAIAVMPFGVYVLVNELVWELPPILCDFYIAMDVTCSTSSILNLVAISIDRFIAVTQPIKYAKHKSNTRVWLTIVFVWAFSGLVGSPIVLGLNAPPEGEEAEQVCTFHNKYFSLFSSLCSFYIPCAILIFLYYRIFKVIRERAKKAVGNRKNVGGGGRAGGGTVIENIAQTKRLAETTLGGPPVSPSGLIISNKSTQGVEDEKLTNTQSASQEEGDAEDLERDGEEEDGSPDSDECHIIPNNQVTTAFVMQTVMRDEERSVTRRGGSLVIEPNGNHDSGYAASNLEESPLPVPELGQLSPTKHSLVVPDQYKRNGLPQSGTSDTESPSKELGESGERSTNLLDVGGGGSTTAFGEEASSSSTRLKTGSRFTICKVHKASRKKREKSSAKRERKATKTLAIVLGLFLACWLPFFTINIIDALCSLRGQDCSPGDTVFLLTTWLGYINSSLNPIVYTIFNTEFRKAFKKLLGFSV